VNFSLNLILTIVTLVVFSCSVKASNQPEHNDAVRLALIKHLAEDPRRLNPEYLRYVFGMPEVSNRQAVMLDREFDWRAPHNNLTLCQLSQSVDKKTGEFTAKFALPIPRASKIDFHTMQSLFNVTPKRHFNQEGFPAETYAISSITKVMAVTPHNWPTVNKIEIEYRGLPLPAPSQQDLNDVKESARDAALVDRGQANQTETVPLLAAYLQEFPNDVEVRIRLAEVYKSRGSLSQAIAQYRLALSQVGTNQELKARCLDGLKQMKVIDPGAPSSQPMPTTSTPALIKPGSLDVGF
jgi:hypothetical protein